MNKTSKMIFITTVVILLAFTLFLFIKPMFSKNDDKNKSETNELTFVFDYSCPWCSLWMEEVYPEVVPILKEKDVNFKANAIAVLNDDSFELAKIDYNIQAHYPEQYLDFLSEVLKELLHNEEINLDHYIKEVIHQFNFEDDIVLGDPDTDIGDLTRGLVEKLNIESVPTILVNGKKVTDPFNIEEIKKSLQLGS